jgi:hypothetical protein
MHLLKLSKEAAAHFWLGLCKRQLFRALPKSIVPSHPIRHSRQVRRFALA